MLLFCSYEKVWERLTLGGNLFGNGFERGCCRCMLHMILFVTMLTGVVALVLSVKRKK